MFETQAQRWLNETRGNAAPKTTGRRLTSLRTFARWARWDNELDEYRAPTPSKTIPHPIPERLEGLERLVIAAGTNVEERAIIGLCGFAGLRISEALAMRPTWLESREMLLTVRGKGDKTRIVPLSTRAWDIISPAFVRAMKNNDPLILMGDRSARLAVARLGRHARLSRPISSHELRATFATVLNDKGVNIRYIQELLGHSSISTTEIYMGVGMTALKEAVNF